MNRINIYHYPDHDPADHDPLPPVLDGWFDESSAEVFLEDKQWDGNNHRSVHTGSEFEHQTLYRTAGGRWVLHCWSQWQGTTPTYRFVTDNTAREWLIRNGDDHHIARLFGELEAERGPGRPEVGPAVNIRLGDLLPAVDQRAKDEGLTRAEMIRRLVAAGIAGQPLNLRPDPNA